MTVVYSGIFGIPRPPRSTTTVDWPPRNSPGHGRRRRAVTFRTRSETRTRYYRPNFSRTDLLLLRRVSSDRSAIVTRVNNNGPRGQYTYTVWRPPNFSKLTIDISPSFCTSGAWKNKRRFFFSRICYLAIITLDILLLGKNKCPSLSEKH